MSDIVDRLNDSLNAGYSELRKEAAAEITRLRAKIEVMKGYPPYVAIDNILTEVMDIAAANGADSRSMPDEYVEVAAWLCGIPPVQPAPNIPEGWKKELFCIQHAMAMNNWNWESDASNDLKRAAYAAVVRLLAASPKES